MFSSSKYNLENVMNDKQQQSQGAVVSESIAIGTIKHFGKLSRGTVMISGLSVSVELEESGGCSRGGAAVAGSRAGPGELAMSAALT